MTDAPDARERLAAALAERYSIERELGVGGMATVYLAQDLRYDRPIALKVLHAELAQALGAERFQREIRLAARLQHPHILTVYDSGEDAGQLWFTMPFVEGETLRDRLTREKQLPVEDALRITREAADALAYAHVHGVVHRDIKPENILLSSRHALVADFGIARALSAGAKGQERLTGTGVSLGTAAYMSPEQAAGEREVDARSDVYSLAIVLYEMLAGETPFSAATPQAMIARRFTDTPRPLRQIRDSVPEYVEQGVQKALSRTAADRFATAAEFATALTPPTQTAAGTVTAPATAPLLAPASRAPAFFATIAVVLIALVAGAAWWMHSRAVRPLSSAVSAPADSSATSGASVAVLPFENLGDSADAYFADGITDAVRGKLTSLPGVAVIARGSSQDYLHTRKPERQIARELGVRYLLTGTVRWARTTGGASDVEVQPELVEVDSAGAPRSRWQQSFETTPKDVFRVQSEIAGKVAEAMRVELGHTEQTHLASIPSTNPAAYDVYLRGQAAWSHGAAIDPASLRRAAGYFERAVAIDSSMAVAWSELSISSAGLYSNSIPTPALATTAHDAAERAIAADSAGAEGYVALGQYYREVAGDNAHALAEYQIALRKAPGDVATRRRIAALEATAGRPDDALRDLRTVVTLDPRSTSAFSELATILMWTRHYPEARAAADRSVALAPNNLNHIQNRALVELCVGDLAAARRVLAASAGDVSPASLAAQMGNYWDTGWVLDDASQRLLLTLGPEAFDGDRGAWAIIHAQLEYLRGDTAAVRVWADTAAAQFAAQLRDAPNDAQRHAIHGLALAYLGQRAQAIAEGTRAVAMAPISQDWSNIYFVHILARIYLLSGDKDKALDQLDILLKGYYFISPGWLRIDPTFNALHGNPRFERMISSS